MSLSEITSVIIFSGIIRNFFLNYKGEIRDLDIVIDGNEELVEKWIKRFNPQKNSFGGYKFKISQLNIDLWEIRNTWAIKKEKIKKQKLFNFIELPNTTFFNFSSVLFDFNNSDFYFNEPFLEFLNNKKIDFVLEDNPMPVLCLVNTIYYMKKFNLDLSNNLKNYYINNFYLYNRDEYEKVQIKHFKKIKYDYEYLEEFYKIFFKQEYSVSINVKNF